MEHEAQDPDDESELSTIIGTPQKQIRHSFATPANPGSASEQVRRSLVESLALERQQRRAEIAAMERVASRILSSRHGILDDLLLSYYPNRTFPSLPENNSSASCSAQELAEAELRRITAAFEDVPSLMSAIRYASIEALKVEKAITSLSCPETWVDGEDLKVAGPWRIQRICQLEQINLESGFLFGCLDFHKTEDRIALGRTRPSLYARACTELFTISVLVRDFVAKFRGVINAHLSHITGFEIHPISVTSFPPSMRMNRDYTFAHVLDVDEEGDA